MCSETYRGVGQVHRSKGTRFFSMQPVARGIERLESTFSLFSGQQCECGRHREACSRTGNDSRGRSTHPALHEVLQNAPTLLTHTANGRSYCSRGLNPSACTRRRGKVLDRGMGRADESFEGIRLSLILRYAPML